MANDFSSDPNCVALWDFESGAFLTDSQGSNDLTNDGADQETSTYKVGSQSAGFVRANTDKLTIAYGDLDVGFPWRYGDGASVEKDFTVAFWMYMNTTPYEDGASSRYVISMYETSTSKRIWAILLSANSEADVIVNLGYNSGGSYDSHIFTAIPDMYSGRWYHIVMRYDYSAQEVTMNIWDDTAGSYRNQDDNYTYPDADPIIETIGLTIGVRGGDSSGWFNGYLDEVVVWNRVLTDQEAEDVKDGTFAYGSTYNLISSIATTVSLAASDMLKESLLTTTIANVTTVSASDMLKEALLTANIPNVTTVSAANILKQVELLSTMALEAVLSAPELNTALINLIATITNQTVLSSADLLVIRQLVSSMVSQVDASTSNLLVNRLLTSAVNSQTTVSSLYILVLINIISTISNISSLSESVLLGVLGSFEAIKSTGIIDKSTIRALKNVFHEQLLLKDSSNSYTTLNESNIFKVRKP